MQNLIDVKTLVDNIDKYIIIDLRSPLEYQAGTIKNAINIPLLDNDARKLVGTLYKENQQEAYREGLKYGMEKLPRIYDEVKLLKEKNSDKKIVFFCFRGGTRSKSVHTVLELMQIHSYKLDGGYKTYRQYILTNISKYYEKIKWLVLTGNTGSGKTTILKKLQDYNYPAIDLEGLANNRGSIFGHIGLGNSVSQSNFENDLFFELKKYIDDNVTNIFIESESKKIGNIYLPIDMYSNMCTSKHILLNVSIEKRVEIINNDYSPMNLDKSIIKDIIKHNEHFKQRLGKKWMNEMLELIDKGEYNIFIKRILLDYYDKLYSYSQDKYQYELVVDEDEIEKVIKILKSYYDNLTKK